MFRFAHLLLSVAFLSLIGCGQGSLTSDPGTPPPHHGDLIRMPGNQGYVEVVKNGGEPGKGSKTSQVAFYFLKDMNTPISPVPTSGTLIVGKKKVSLSAKDEGLVTPADTTLFPRGDLDGTLSVELDGKIVSIPLGIR
jgi:hypothetical protein